MKTSHLAGSLAAALSLMSFSALAATDDMTISATVDASCSVTAPAVALGAYDPIAGTAIGIGDQIDFTCTNGTTYAISLGNGLHYDGTGLTRRMQHSGAGTGADDYLTYGIFEGTDNTTAWDGMSGASTGATQAVDIFVEADAGQTTVKAGAYSDTIVVTVTAS